MCTSPYNRCTLSANRTGLAWVRRRTMGDGGGSPALQAGDPATAGCGAEQADLAVALGPPNVRTIAGSGWLPRRAVASRTLPADADRGFVGHSCLVADVHRWPEVASPSSAPLPTQRRSSESNGSSRSPFEATPAATAAGWHFEGRPSGALGGALDLTVTASDEAFPTTARTCEPVDVRAGLQVGPPRSSRSSSQEVVRPPRSTPA